ncbi:SDR family NAD(P)-dependent oxidoreductase [Desulfoluna butyratoxydans]|uniref:Enoyl-(Acyl carrier protein) reductase n=1 Tax=Desulfoluna butyratoxydans TaxID=231438 RepID=A0A4U8YJM9_9BACT|nr:SDR family oxidoreductase [Desulfoluna butyratoxydans]VFQ43975.1 enoyl-(acyl carrier protein) reductase [Desulfoluna butyratoxydans]
MADERVALVLGAVKGIGREIGLSLARRGIRTVLTWHDWEESLPAMEAAFAEVGCDHEIVRVDLTDTEVVPGLIKRVIDRFGRLDILINNIERGGMPVVHGTYTKNQWELEVATTLTAKRWVFEAALPYLKKAPDGCVVNLTSIAGVVGRSGPASYLFNEGYSALNRGISLLTETWARLGAPNVRVNELMLGVMDTRHGKETRGWGMHPDKVKKGLVDHTLLGRTGTPDDVVKAVSFLAFDAPFMTGSVIRLDGGYVLGGDRVWEMPEGVEKL